MKFNWNTLKIVLAFVVIGSVAFWAVDSTRSRSYSGTDLNFDTAGGTITITNPSDDPVAAQFTGLRSRTFRVSSTIDEVTGSSTRVGTGSTRIHQFEFELPPGTGEFTISGGTDVQFMADTTTELQATVNPMSSESLRNTLIATAVVVVGALFYASNATDHHWFRLLRQRFLPSRSYTAQQNVEAAPERGGGQGRAARPFGDNRANTGD